MSSENKKFVASLVFIENAPCRWVVRVNTWGGATVADCGEDGEANAVTAKHVAVALNEYPGLLIKVGVLEDARAQLQVDVDVMGDALKEIAEIANMNAYECGALENIARRALEQVERNREN